MILSLILLSLAITGFVVVFTQLREETTLLQKAVDLIPYPVSHAINCPFCMSYWLALITSIFIIPFAGWNIAWRFSTDTAWLEPLFKIIVGWFLIGFLANLWRVIYQLIGKDMSLADLEAKELRKDLEK